MQYTIYWIEIAYLLLLETFYTIDLNTWHLVFLVLKNVSRYITFSKNELPKLSLSEHFTHL